MVDKENQWEDIEYSEGEETQLSYNDEDTSEMGEYYSEQGDNQEYEEYEDDEEPVQRKNNPIPIIIVFLLLLGAGAFVAVPKFMGGAQINEKIQDNKSIEKTVDTVSSNQPSDDLANSFFADAGGVNPDMMSVNFNENGETNVLTGEGENTQVATVTETPQNNDISETDLFENQDSSISTSNADNNSIMVVYNKAARLNPFKPPVVDKTADQAYETINNTQFEIIEPPVTSVPDENLTKLLQTQISGILYDNESPSAIINLNGLDQFVKAGDIISGYKIESITRDKVQISYKNNSYIAAVGELFTRGSLEKQPAVANLEKKFAGRYKNQEKLEE